MVVEHGSGDRPAGASPKAGATGYGEAVLEQLMARIAQGDRDAFASFYDYAAGMIYGLVRDITGDQARAEKVTEDVLAEIWRTAPQFSESEGSALSWMFSITRRRAAGRSYAVDRDSRDPQALARTIAAVTSQAGKGPPAELAPGGLPALAEVQRHALVLACYGGYAQDEIADLLGIPGLAVATQIRDGLLKLHYHTK